MNREIKFRKWNGKMHYCEGRLAAFFGCMEPGDEIMQFTGLRDADNKEVYEGDVILHGTGGLRGQGEVRWSDEDCRFCVVRNNTRYDIYCPEVIGNIYEHPELLAK